jgi:Protein of unknown function (DUF3579)
MRFAPCFILRAQVLYKTSALKLLCNATLAILMFADLPTHPMSTPIPPPASIQASKQVFIQGITKDGKTFRPSDWAERLCGVMSSFRPGGAVPGSHLGYSEWCVPTNLGDIKCVVAHRDLRDHEPMAWDFVMNFARDNDLQVVEACLLPTA